jgi:hypothetical protein
MPDSKSQALLEIFLPDAITQPASGCAVSILPGKEDIQMANPVSARPSAIVDRFFNDLERQFGLPRQIVHDNSREFFSESYFKALLEEVYQEHAGFPLAAPDVANEAGDAA